MGLDEKYQPYLNCVQFGVDPNKNPDLADLNAVSLGRRLLSAALR